MFCRSIGWFICTFVAVAIVTGYSGQYFNTGLDSQVKIYHLRNDNLESSTSGPVQEVSPSTAVDLGALLDAGEGAVVVVVSEDTRLAAHRAVLSARSAVFQRLLQDAATGDVAVPDVEGPVLRQLLSYLYTLQAPQLPVMVPQLLAAAHQYGLPALKADCEQQVAKQLTVETAAATALLAVRHSCDSLRKASIDYIRTHIFHVMATQGWADAINTQPQVMIKVMQLLSQSPAETRSSAPTESGSSTHHATQPHSDYSSQQTPTTAVPTTVAQTITQTDGGHTSLLRYFSSQSTQWQAACRAFKATISISAKPGRGTQSLSKRLRPVTSLMKNWQRCREPFSREEGQEAWKGHEEAARRLQAAGAAVVARESAQQRPLHWAAWRGHMAVMRLLLENGADHGARAEGGNTPLHWAAHRGHREAAAALLEAGADRAARDNWGKTPLDDTREGNQQHVVELLEGSSPTAGTGWR